jgi:uncharacterized protein YgiM (DUF1202 family)
MNIMKKTLIKFSILCILAPAIPIYDKASAQDNCPGVPPLTDPLAIRMENGDTLIWDKVDKGLIAAKIKYEKLLEVKGWKIKYESAYRPLQYQEHFYKLVNAPASACKSAELKKHGLVGVVAKPNPNAPHVKGIAFDAIVTNKYGVALNGKNFVNSALITVANQAGLKFPLIKADGVHHELNSTVTKLSKTKSKISEKPFNATGKITTKSGFNVRKTPSTSLKRLGLIKKNSNVTIVAITGDWYKIRYGKGYGYIKAVKNGLSITKKEQITKNRGTVVAPSGLNVRKSASINSPKTGWLKKGTSVTIVSKNGDWYKIKYGKSYGWVNKKFVKI